MKEQAMNAPWDHEGWIEKAKAWIQSTLDEQGIVISGEIEPVSIRPWSTVMMIPTEVGRLFFKATAGIARHEIGFSDYLSTIAGDRSLSLVAINLDEAWMIMRDGGQRLREVLQANKDWQHWQNLLPQYADLQITLAQNPSKLFDLGMPNRDLGRFPELYASLIAERAVFQPDSEDALTDAEYQRLLDLIPVVAEKAQQLASYNIPHSVHHGDLHDANIFCNQAHYRFADWGDSSYSHPFFSLRTSYVNAEVRFNLEEGSPELNRLRDAYLVPWRAFETEANLQIAFDLASELWAISSALIWYQVIENLDSETRPDYQYVLPSLANELLTGIKI